jgi:hypothetical protein
MDPKKYETEKVKLPKSGDCQRWRYKMRNGESGKEFEYTIYISGTALALPGDLIEDAKKAIISDGYSMVEKWLSEGKEKNLVAMVEALTVKEFTDAEWKVYWGAR